MRSKSELLVQSNTKLTDRRLENKMKKIGSKDSHILLSQLLAGAKPNKLSFQEFRRSRLDDIRVPIAFMAVLIARTVAVALEARQCW